jgi:hypothetical protein
MRLRAPAALSSCADTAPDSALHEDPMSDRRSPTARAASGPIAPMLLAAFLLAACVQSKTPLLTGTKPVLGNLFQLNLFENFSDGMATTLKTSVFRWDATHYVHVSGDSSDVKYFVAEPLNADTFLIEATDEKVYAYLLGVRLADGIYRILPVDEKYVDKATQARLCAAQKSENCTVATRQQLDTFVRASLGKTIDYTMFGVISFPKN